MLLYQAQEVLLGSLQGEYWVKDAVEAMALLLVKEGEERRLVLLVLALEMEDWDDEGVAVLEASLPVVSEPVPEPELEPVLEPVSEPVVEPV